MNHVVGRSTALSMVVLTVARLADSLTVGRTRQGLAVMNQTVGPPTGDCPEKMTSKPKRS